MADKKRRACAESGITWDSEKQINNKVQCHCGAELEAWRLDWRQKT